MDSQVELIYQTVKQDITYQEIPAAPDPFCYDNDDDYKTGIQILEPVKCEPFDTDVKILDTGGDQMATLQPVNCFDYEGAAELMQADIIQASNISTIGPEALTILPLSTTSSFEFGGETWQLVTTQQQVLPQLQQVQQVQQLTLSPLQQVTQLHQVTIPQLQSMVLSDSSQTLTALKTNFVESCEYITADSTISPDTVESDLSSQPYPVEVKQEHYAISNGDSTPCNSQFNIQETVISSNNETNFSSEDSVQNQVYESLGNLDGLALRYEVINSTTQSVTPTQTTAQPAKVVIVPKPKPQPKEKVDPLGPMIRMEMEENGTAWYCRLCTYQTRDRRYIRKHVTRVHCKPKNKSPPAPIVAVVEPKLIAPAPVDVCTVKTEPLDADAIADPLATVKQEACAVKCEPQEEDESKKSQSPPAAEHVCNICGWKARARYILQNHLIGKHQEGRPYPCELCSYKAKFKSSYLRHVQTIHEGLRPYSCQYCQYKATQKSCLERHVKAQHSQTKPFGCAFCPFRSTSRTEVDHHLDTKHDGRRPLTCYTCGFTTLHKRVLREHMLRKHDNRRPYACHYRNCTYRTARRTSLDNHIKYKHVLLRPFKCFHCEYTATSKSNVRAHIVSIHVRARPKLARPKVRKKDMGAGKPVRCECGLLCDTRFSYAKHRCEAHGEEVLTCSVCPYITNVASNLHKHTANKHLRSHGLLQGFRACAYCQFNSHSKRALRHHIKTVHKFG